MLSSSLLAGFDPVTPEGGRLLSAIAQLPQALESNPVYAWYRLPKPVLQKAQQLVHLLMELRSPESGWPLHLAHTAENLTPYVTEEAYELLDALQQWAQSRQGGLMVAPADPLHLVDWQLRQTTVAALRSQLLWETASSGHGVMRLIQGVSARVGDASARLYLVMTLQTQSEAIDLNGPDEGITVAADMPICLEGEGLASVPQTAGALLKQIHRALQGNPILSRFFQRQAVQLLQPGAGWQQTFLQISPRLVSSAAPAEADLDLIEPVDPLDDFVLPVLPEADLELLNGAVDSEASAIVEPPEDDLTILTADDLALALTGSLADDRTITAGPAQTVPAVSRTPDTATAAQNVQQNGAEKNGGSLALAEVNGSSANGRALKGREKQLPTETGVAADNLVPAWITVTDDRWIATLSEMIARQQLIAELPLSRLLEQLSQPQAELDNLLAPVIEAASAATAHADAETGLLHQNFFQRAIYLEDLLPQLLWYVYRASPVIAQLINGIPARFLAPDRLWQTGELRLLTTLQLRTRQRKMMIDLATSTPLSFPVQRLHREGVVQSNVLPLTQPPYTVAQLETRLYRLLRQATPELDWLLRGTSLELHLLEPLNEPEQQVGAMQLGLGLQFTSAPTTVIGEVVGAS